MLPNIGYFAILPRMAKLGQSLFGCVFTGALIVATPALILGGHHFDAPKASAVGWILFGILALVSVFSKKRKAKKMAAGNTLDELSLMAIDGKFKPNASTRAFLSDLLERLQEIDGADDESDSKLAMLTTDIESILNPKDFR